MKGRKTMIGLTFINPQYIQEAEFETVSGNSESGKPKTGHLKILLIAAMVSTMLLLTGAGLYTRWSNTAQARYQPSEQIKDQAEKSGLSTVVSETQTAENTGEVLSVTDQGITISLVQTIVDNYRAELTFRIQGFELPEGRYPAVWPVVTLDGSDEDFFSSCSGSFFDGTTHNAQGKRVYTDGTPVQRDADGSVILRYADSDGSLEYTEYISFQKTDGRYFGKEIQVTFPDIGLDSTQMAVPYDPVVQGNWTLKWTLTGTGDNISIAPNAEIGDTGVVLLDAEIGQKTIRTRYQVPALWDGWDELVTLPQAIYGVRMKDGAQYLCVPGTSGFEDQEKMIYFVESNMFDAILDPSQVESLLFFKDWQRDAEGKPTVEEFYEIPVK